VPADDNDHLIVHRLIQRVVREHAEQAKPSSPARPQGQTDKARALRDKLQ
jgi:hypothetical protein